MSHIIAITKKQQNPYYHSFINEALNKLFSAALLCSSGVHKKKLSIMIFLPTSQEALIKQLLYLQVNPPEILR